MEELRFSDDVISDNNNNHLVSQIVQALLKKKINEKKEIFNEIPLLRFVKDNISLYNQNLEKRKSEYTLLTEEEKRLIEERISVIKDSSYEQRLPGTNTLSSEDTRDVLKTLPLPLLNISNLQNLDYSQQNDVLIPRKFDDEGNWIKSVRSVPFSLSEEEIEKDFQTDQHYPLMKEHYESGLMLIGKTSNAGDIVYQTSISPYVSTHKDAITAYQKHVLVHEFFHTVFAKFRSIPNANNLIMKCKDGTTSTFAEWRNAFLLSMQEEPIYTTKYASVYDKDMMAIANGEKGQDDYGLEEQLCESLTAYYLDIAPNDYGWISFEKFNFGNKDQKDSSTRYKLVNDFYTSDFEIVGQ